MATKIFVNLPVADLHRSTEFFTRLGYSFDPRFSDENAACLIISDDIYAMLLTRSFFQSFINKEIADTGTSNEAILALTVDSRQRVDDLVDRAMAAGGTAGGEATDEAGMYGRTFQDPDGHLWEVFHMEIEPSRTPTTPAADQPG